LIGKILIGCVRLYQWTLSPLLPAWCRFHPSCSAYMVEAIRTHGPVAGTWLGLKRIGRCRPGGGSGFDLVPPKEPAEPR